jgi:hypothetical protein
MNETSINTAQHRRTATGAVVFPCGETCLNAVDIDAVLLNEMTAEG